MEDMESDWRRTRRNLLSKQRIRGLCSAKIECCIGRFEMEAGCDGLSTAR